MSALRIGLLSLGDRLADPVGGGRPTDGERQCAIVESAVLAERLGFDSAWLWEPAAHDTVLRAPSVVLAAIAARTERLRLGTSGGLAAGLDPVRVAEDVATLDALSGGRVELVAGRAIGDASGEESDESRARLRENVELLRRLWTETGVSWSGRFRAPLVEVTVEPRPVQQPHPPLWIGETSASAVQLAAELGLPLLLPGPSLAPARLTPVVERYRERAARAGQPARVGACRAVHIRADSQEAHEAWRPYWANFQRFAAREPQPGEAPVCGSPAEVVDRLLALREALDLELLLLAFDVGGLPERALRETLERFGRDVLPHLAAPGAVG